MRVKGRLSNAKASATSPAEPDRTKPAVPYRHSLAPLTVVQGAVNIYRGDDDEGNTRGPCAGDALWCVRGDTAPLNERRGGHSARWLCLWCYSRGGLLPIPLAASNRTHIAEACTMHKQRGDKRGSAACTLQKRKPVDKFDTWGSTMRKPVGKSDTSV